MIFSEFGDGRGGKELTKSNFSGMAAGSSWRKEPVMVVWV